MSPEDRKEWLQERYERISNLILAKAQNEVRLIGVTKGLGVEAINVAKDLGINDFGENYAQELLEKESLVSGDINWHFIGQIQSNKIRKVSHIVSTWHSVTSIKIAKEIHRRNEGVSILLQVLIKGPSNSKGFKIEEIPNVVNELRNEGVNLSGLMTMGVPEDKEETRESFVKLRQLADALELQECSMGMSGDFEIALESGATMIRIGSAIFGNRRVD